MSGKSLLQLSMEQSAATLQATARSSVTPEHQRNLSLPASRAGLVLLCSHTCGQVSAQVNSCAAQAPHGTESAVQWSEVFSCFILETTTTEDSYQLF